VGTKAVVSWAQCQGRDGWDHPLAVPEDMGTEMLNVIFQDGGLAKKRGGSSTVTLSSNPGGVIVSMRKFVPAQNLAAAELFIVDSAGTPVISRIASGNTRSALALTDAIATRQQDTTWASVGGNLYIAYDSTVNRLQVFRPGESTTAVFRAGLPAPAAPTAANTGTGSYAATIRYYRVQWRVVSGTKVLRQSNLSASLSFTPSGSGTAARVTRPAEANESETHWALYGAEAEAGPYYELAQTLMATTTYDDSTAPSSYDLGEVAPLDGSNYPFPSVKYLATDGVRLFGLGVWESTAGNSVLPVAGRVYFSPPIGATDADDAERIQFNSVQDDYVDLSVNGIGGVDRGLGGPINGVIFAFQSTGIYMLVPTGQATAPFRRVIVTQDKGAVSHESIVSGEDERGQPCVYFLDPTDGPRRLAIGSTVEWLGKDVDDLWQTVNLAATGKVAWGVYDSREKLVIWAIATGASNYPDRMIVYDVTHGRISEDGSVRRGWVTWTGPLTATAAGTMFPSTLDASRPLTETLYVGPTSSAILARQDTSTTDYGTEAFQGYIRSKAFDWQPLGRTKRIMRSFLVALKSASYTVLQSLISDWGKETRTSTVSLDGSASQTRVRAQSDLDMASLITAQVQLGDASAVASSWELDRWEAEVEVDQGAVQ
jgi:hypothetical protein